MESAKIPTGFKTVPGFSRYAISEDGVLVYIQTGEKINFYSEEGGYLKASLYNDANKWVLTGRHRLMALTYLPIPETDEVLVVNHLDGIKYHDTLDNLEWTTYQGNQWHAGLHKLTSKCIPTLVYDVDTGNETLYPSALEAGKALGLTKDAVLWRLGTDGQRPFPERKLYKSYHSESKWAKIDPTKKIEFGRCREVVVNFIQTGEIRTYDSAREAARAVGCGDAAMSVWLNKLDGYPVLPGLIQVKYATDTNDFPVVDDPWVELMKHTKHKCVFAFHETENRLEIFPSGRACAMKHGITVTNLHYKLQSSGKKVFKDGYRYGYYPENLGPLLR